MSRELHTFATDAVSPEELVVSSFIERDELRGILRCLAAEDSVHSWRSFGDDGTLQDLVRWENERRPTDLFFFYRQIGDVRRVVAAGAVADRLTRDFPHRGFCVLGRCCILPEFRGQGFYRHVLRYRLEYCRRRFGDALNAIHIGTTDERVSRVIANHGLPGWPAFVHLGEEHLHVAGSVRPVGAHMLVLPEYLGRLRRAMAGVGAPSSVIALRHEFSKIGGAPVRDLGVLLARAFEDAEAAGWFNGRDVRALEQLLLFCRSIPVVGLR